MTEKLLALESNQTWNLVPQIPRALYKYKARLIGRESKQEYGKDYEETFAPVANAGHTLATSY